MASVSSPDMSRYVIVNRRMLRWDSLPDELSVFADLNMENSVQKNCRMQGVTEFNRVFGPPYYPGP